MSNYARQHLTLDEFLSSPRRRREARDDLASYFEPGKFTGSQFNSFRQPDNEGEDKDRITWDDIIAVKMLSIDIPTTACLELVSDEGGKIGRLLEGIKPTPLYSATDDPLRNDGDADKVWHRLRETRGVGWVTAGKLLARKRPAVVPIYDDVVRAILGAPRGFWRCMSTYFADDSSRATQWAALRDEVPEVSEISVLRTIDIVLWSQGKRGSR